MTDTEKKRRRWPWLVLFVLALLLGGPIAWRFRPLTAAEKAFVGRWTMSGVADQAKFRSDHRILLGGAPAGCWSASETGTANLIVQLEVWERFHKVAKGARPILVAGQLQNHSNVVRLLVEFMKDLTALLEGVDPQLRDLR